MKLTRAPGFSDALGSLKLSLKLTAGLFPALLKALGKAKCPAPVETFSEAFGKGLFLASAKRVGGVAQHDAGHADVIGLGSRCSKVAISFSG